MGAAGAAITDLLRSPLAPGMARGEADDALRRSCARRLCALRVLDAGRRGISKSRVPQNTVRRRVGEGGRKRFRRDPAEVDEMRTLGLLLAVACQAQTFRVAGTILNSESAAPVGKARISLIATGRTRTVVTAPDGRFSFDVPAGKYSLVADVREMRQGYGLRTPNAGFGIAIIAGPDQKTDDLVFRWFPPAVLTGRILDSFGEPVERAQISMTRIAVLNGERHVYFYGNRYTDDRGEYRFAPILPGSYYVRVSATPWYASNTLPLGMHYAAEDTAT